jgi:hypothetical protein
MLRDHPKRARTKFVGDRHFRSALPKSTTRFVSSGESSANGRVNNISGRITMKLGIISMWGDDLAAFRNQIRLAEELGFALVGLGDSPVGWHELYVSMTIAAQETTSVTLAPMVTTPIARHPAVAE